LLWLDLSLRPTSHHIEPTNTTNPPFRRVILLLSFCQRSPFFSLSTSCQRGDLILFLAFLPHFFRRVWTNYQRLRGEAAVFLFLKLGGLRILSPVSWLFVFLSFPLITEFLPPRKRLRLLSPLLPSLLRIGFLSANLPLKFYSSTFFFFFSAIRLPWRSQYTDSSTIEGSLFSLSSAFAGGAD